MAWVTGTAADQNDLLDKLVTFLTTDTNLVAAGQNWTALRTGALPFTETIATGRIAFSANTWNTVLLDPWPGVIPNTNVRMNITGNLNAPTTGSYTFGVHADDMIEIRIDGTLVFSQYIPTPSAGPFPSSFTLSLSAGNHTLDIRYIAFTGSYNFLTIGWQKPGDSSIAVIPAANYNGLSIAWNVIYDGKYGSKPEFDTAYGQKEAVLMGPGLSGTDQVYAMLNTMTEYTNDRYNIVGRGAAGFNSTLPIASQPGVPTYPAAILLWNQPMKYWFVANGRRFIVIAKASTVYEVLYAGFILPYALPTEIPYPLMVGGNSYNLQARWSVQGDEHSSVWRPGTQNAALSNVHFRNVSGAWEYYVSFSSSSGYSGNAIYPTRGGTTYRSDPSGSYALTPLTLYSSNSGGNVWGEMDGVYHVSGFANGSENIITVSGQDYLVVQSGYRTTIVDYAAVKLA